MKNEITNKTTTKKGQSTMTTTITTKTANEKRLAQAQERNEKRLATTKQQIEQATANNENIINHKAVDLIQRLKETKNKNDKIVVNDLYSIGSMLLQSKLKNLNKNEKTYNENNRKLKIDTAIVIDTKNGNGTSIDTAIEELNSLYIEKYNKDGEKIIECVDTTREEEIIEEIASYANSNGLPLVHDAITKLWYYIQKEIDEKGIENISDDLLLKTFQQVIPHSKVYRNGDIKPAELWQYKTTNAIKETSLEISRQINALKPIKDTNNKAYIPFDTIINDNETITQYKKASYISVCSVCDINGKEIVQTANETTENLIENVLEKANFTKNESYIFKNYIVNQKYTTSQIIDKMNVSEQYFNKTLQTIRRKCAVVLCENTKYTIQDTYKPNNEQKKQKIICCLSTDEKEKEIATFESIGKASEFLNIDKGNISKCLKGERKTANGYTFKYAENN